MEWMEFLAFGCRALAEKRERVKRGSLKLPIMERIILEVAYWGLMCILVLIMIPVSLVAKTTKKIRKN